MGQGGCITIVNSTNYDFIKTDISSYQMSAWKFPDKIPAMTESKMYVEWNEGVFKTVSDDSGNVHYSIQGTKDKFQVQARSKGRGKYHLKIYFESLTTQTVKSGETMDLGWDHDGNVSFVLAGKSGSYFSNGGNAANWMKDNLSLLGNKTLRDICIVGSHDSGMSKLGPGGTVGGGASTTLTQSYSVGKQLELGARYFDIRPVIGEGDYYTGHYSPIGSSWQGANGQSIDSIVKDINNFTARHNELVILNISHTLNTTVGNTSYRKFNQDEWKGLFSKICKIHNRAYVGEDNSKINLVQKKLNDLINGKPAVLIVVDNKNEKVNLDNYKTEGIFSFDNFKFYDSYSNTDDAKKMANDQIKKMKDEAKPDSVFLLSWTLTQGFWNVVKLESIKKLAHEANRCLSYELYPTVSKSVFPNIIYVDDIKTNEAAAMAMAVNTKILM